MCYIPLVISFLMAYFCYKKNGVDLSFFVSFIYIISSFCAIILIEDEQQVFLEDYRHFEISFTPTLLYILIIILSVYPLYKFNTNKIRKINKTIDTGYLDKLLFCYIIAFIITIVLFGNTIPERLVLSNMKEYRDISHSDDTIMVGLPFTTKILAYLALGLGSGGFALIVYFYFCLAFTNKSKLYLVIILLLSMLPVFNGILAMDRSNAFYWGLLLCLGFFLFKPYLTRNKKRFLIKSSFITLAILAVYFIAVSIARFDESDAGTFNTIVDYAGQPYLNFCNEWNCLSIKEYSFVDVFPVLKLLTSYDSTDFIINPKQIPINGFHTYAGYFMFSFGHFGVVFFPLLIFVIVIFFSRKRVVYMDVKSFTVLFLIFAIPQTGVISYFYGTEWRFIYAFFFVYWSSKMRNLKDKFNLKKLCPV